MKKVFVIFVIIFCSMSYSVFAETIINGGNIANITQYLTRPAHSDYANKTTFSVINAKKSDGTVLGATVYFYIDNTEPSANKMLAVLIDARSQGKTVSVMYDEALPFYNYWCKVISVSVE